MAGEDLVILNRFNVKWRSVRDVVPDVDHLLAVVDAQEPLQVLPVNLKKL